MGDAGVQERYNHILDYLCSYYSDLLFSLTILRGPGCHSNWSLGRKHPLVELSVCMRNPGDMDCLLFNITLGNNRLRKQKELLLRESILYMGILNTCPILCNLPEMNFTF